MCRAMHDAVRTKFSLARGVEIGVAGHALRLSIPAGMVLFETAIVGEIDQPPYLVFIRSCKAYKCAIC